MNTRPVTTAIPVSEFPVAQGNFNSDRAIIDTIILHTEVGFRAGTRTTFNTPGKEVSAHYGVNEDGTLDHYLEEFFVAFHAKNYNVNRRSIGIEHEDFRQPNAPRPDALYQTSSRLVADICRFYSIPCDRQHIRPHSEVSDTPTSCPDTLDIDRIIRGAQLILNPQPMQPAQTAKITSVTGANIRRTPDTKTKPSGIITNGTVITLEGVVNGETVNGNNVWLQLKGQLAYVWSGSTDFKAAQVPPTSANTDQETALQLLGASGISGTATQKVTTLLNFYRQYHQAIVSTPENKILSFFGGLFGTTGRG